ncbi:MAG TPA: hypothetical protein VL460_10930 [Caulobacteraceae bacterium]|jgi:hypothetical protein|nr:hypothetical protein [Caulobacteraceae bacterium]
MKPFLAALAVAAVALGACYQSKTLLLDPKLAATPLATGRQTVLDDGGMPEDIEIALGPDRWYRIKDAGAGEDKADRFLFTPLAGGPEGRWLAFAMQDKTAFVYGVAEQRDGKVYLDLPFCDLGPTRDIAIAHGVKVAAKGAMSPICQFDKAADLQGALADYARRPGDRTKLAVLPGAP